METDHILLEMKKTKFAQALELHETTCTLLTRSAATLRNQRRPSKSSSIHGSKEREQTEFECCNSSGVQNVPMVLKSGVF